jgi:hypothetical protein
MIRWVAPVLIVVVIGGGLVAKVLLDNAQNDLLCQAVNENRAALRNLLVSARNQTARRQLTKKAQRFFRTQLAAIKPLDCGKFNRDSLGRQGGGKRGGDAPPGKTKQPP